MTPLAAKKVFLTGASGFVGGHLVDALLAAGHSVTALVRSTSNRKWINPGAEVMVSDLENLNGLRKAVVGHDVVYHCAALMSQYDWMPLERFESVNVLGSMKLLDACCESGLEQFCYVSTVGVLGATSALAVAETAPYGHGLSRYELSKRQTEEAVRRRTPTLPFPVTILRPAQLYGPRMVYGWPEVVRKINRRSMRIIGHGTALLHLTEIQDVIQGLIGVLGIPRTFGEIYHLAGPTIPTIRKVFDHIAQVLGAPLPPSVPVPIAQLVVSMAERIPQRLKPDSFKLLTHHRLNFFLEHHAYSTEKAQKDFGYTPRVGLEEGIPRMIDWMRSEGFLD